MANEVTIHKKGEQDQTFTQTQFEQMMALFAKLQEQQGENMMKAIEKLKEPDEFTKEKQEKERALALANRVSSMQGAIDEERGKEARWFHCKHKKTSHGIKDPAHAFMGQVNNDGFFRPLCCRCTFVFPRVKATDEQIRNGVGLKDIDGLTAEIMLTWHRRTDANCKECAKGQCAVRWLRMIKQGHLDAPVEITPEGKIRAEEAVAAMAV